MARSPEQQSPEGTEDFRISEEPIKAEQPEKALELEEKISQEQEKAKEDFGDLIGMVNERYLNLPEKMRETFIEHNEDILDAVVELGMKKGLTQQELKLTEIAAIIHDMTKAEPDKEEVGNYTLANHGEAAAAEVETVVTSDMLEKAGVDVSDDNASLEAKKTIADAVREHMGPHPGFMDGILAGVNKAIEAKNKELIEQGREPLSLIEHPKASGKVSETLLAADMGSLASRSGREKVMSIRSNVPFFASQDEGTAAEYQRYGIDLTMGEAALLSGFDSAADSHDMLPDISDRKRTMSLIDESKKEAYKYINPDTGEEEKITWQEATQKRVEFLPKWIMDEQKRIESGEYGNEKELENAQRALDRAIKDLDRAKIELERF